jgi:hypothetical protein
MHDYIGHWHTLSAHWCGWGWGHWGGWSHGMRILEELELAFEESAL